MKTSFPQKSLHNWFQREQRQLPWRAARTKAKRDPYAVWILETMLQQTQLKTVLPYYQRWMQRYPDIKSLARSNEEEALVYFQGLGYYRRLKALLQGAKTVVTAYNGIFPADKEKLLAIAGIGPYTAGAILSFAFHQRSTLVDGNIVRVLSRYYALAGASATLARSGSAVWRALEDILPKTGVAAAKFNEALMELGSLVCLRSRPRCLATSHSLAPLKPNAAGQTLRHHLACPLMKTCQAYKLRRVHEYPLKKSQAIEIVYSTVILIRHTNRYLLFKRASGQRLGGMWEFPTLEHHPPHETLTQADYIRLGQKKWQLELRLDFSEQRWLTAHYTRYRAKVRVLAGKIVSGSARGGYQWYDVTELAKIGLSSLHSRIRLSDLVCAHVFNNELAMKG